MRKAKLHKPAKSRKSRGCEKPKPNSHQKPHKPTKSRKAQKPTGQKPRSQEAKNPKAKKKKKKNSLDNTPWELKKPSYAEESSSGPLLGLYVHLRCHQTHTHTHTHTHSPPASPREQQAVTGFSACSKDIAASYSQYSPKVKVGIKLHFS